MEIYKKSVLRRSRAAGVFLLCAVLTGCAGREAEFLAEGFREEKAGDMQAFETEGETGAEAAGKRAGEAANDRADAEAAGKRIEEEKESGTDAKGTGKSAGADEIPYSAVLTEEQQVPAEIYVDVCGAVVKPGVFKLTEGSRVFQAIEAAGGYLPEAAEGYVNRAGFLTDGQQIYVPTEEEAETPIFPGTEVRSDKSADASAAGVSDGKVNLNTADEAGLTTLTGIGSTRAQAILSYREECGPFQSIEDIMNVPGIKEGTFEKIKDNITIQ